jgi:hypothetical protein
MKYPIQAHLAAARIRPIGNPHAAMEKCAMSKILWMAALASVLSTWAPSPAACQAQAKCPWLNAATAAGVLGGEVEMNVKQATGQVAAKGAGAASYEDQVRMDRFDVSCTFTRQTSSGLSLLLIDVRTMPDIATSFPPILAACPGKRLPLRGIGNEAFQCEMDSSGHAGSDGQEQVIARVRDRAFVLTIRRGAKAQSSGGLSDDARNIAEQVAGSLF